MFVIYCHTNKINNKKYIGMTNDLKRRWRREGSEYKSATRFYEAILKYGWLNFDHDILESDLDENTARERERFYIALYETNNPDKGYNTDKGGLGGKIYATHPRNMLGKSRTDFQKENQSRLMCDKSFNPMQNGSCVWGVTHIHPRGMTGKKHSTEHNELISQKMKEKKINCKSVKVSYPDGKIEIYDSTQDAQKIGLSKPFILKIIRSQKPYEIKVINQYTEKVKHLVGITIAYLDNTEIT